MRTNKTLKVKVVHEETAEKFEAKLNDVLANSKNASIEWNHSLGFCAYVTYEEETDIAECAADIFHKDGIYWHCRNCPYLERPSDKRLKRGGCRIKSTGETRMDSEACEFLYQQLLSGGIKRDDLIED